MSSPSPDQKGLGSKRTHSPDTASAATASSSEPSSEPSEKKLKTSATPTASVDFFVDILCRQSTTELQTEDQLYEEVVFLLDRIQRELKDDFQARLDAIKKFVCSLSPPTNMDADNQGTAAPGITRERARELVMRLAVKFFWFVQRIHRGQTISDVQLAVNAAKGRSLLHGMLLWFWRTNASSFQTIISQRLYKVAKYDNLSEQHLTELKYSMMYPLWLLCPINHASLSSLDLLRSRIGKPCDDVVTQLIYAMRKFYNETRTCILVSCYKFQHDDDLLSMLRQCFTICADMFLRSRVSNPRLAFDFVETLILFHKSFSIYPGLGRHFKRFIINPLTDNLLEKWMITGEPSFSGLIVATARALPELKDDAIKYLSGPESKNDLSYIDCFAQFFHPLLFSLDRSAYQFKFELYMEFINKRTASSAEFISTRVTPVLLSVIPFMPMNLLGEIVEYGFGIGHASSILTSDDVKTVVLYIARLKRIQSDGRKPSHVSEATFG